MERRPSRRCRAWRLFTLLGLSLAPLSAPVLGQESVRRDYFRRLAAVSPRDAPAYHELARWCRAAGLQKESRRLLERVIRVDPDHAGARAALGYRRHGLGWRMGTPPPPGGTGAVPGPPTGGGAGGAEPGTSGATGAGVAGGPGVEIGTGDSGAEVVTPPDPELDAIADPVERKLAFARQAALKLKINLNTKEDPDFLIHTTFDITSPRVRQLASTLKSIKKLVQTISGAPARARIWPHKVQIFFFRAVSECTLFSEVVDGQRFPELDGWYTLDDHTVFFRVDGEVLAEILGESALDHLDGSDRFVNWWLRIGLAELVASQTETGKKGSRYQDAHDLVASELEVDTTAFHLSDLLDTPGMEERAPDVSRARALTLVDFLYQLRKSGFHRFIAELKGSRAPPPPQDFSDPTEFRRFFIDFIAFQHESLTRNFRLKIEQLDARWKKFVLDRGDSRRKRR